MLLCYYTKSIVLFDYIYLEKIDVVYNILGTD